MDPGLADTPGLRVAMQGTDWQGIGQRFNSVRRQDLAGVREEGIRVPVSIGELYDKITILMIKLERLADPVKQVNVRHELDLLRAVEAGLANRAASEALVAELLAINAALWDIEDAKRAHERRQDFGPAFVELARQVYLRNDRRAAVKRRINEVMGSAIVEEKSHDLGQWQGEPTDLSGRQEG
jgi:Family of unknown function (DUF6165)